jgi:aspartyl-tRNA(Asn)/glutamyl-tRNA(Gln) amidotransferase subunit B
MPELPDSIVSRFVADYDLSFIDASQLVSDKSLSALFEETAEASGDPRSSANWILGDLLRELNSAGIPASESPVSSSSLAELIRLIGSGKISGKQAKDVLPEMFSTGRSAGEVVSEKGLEQVSDEGAIAAIVDEVIAANPGQVAAYRNGNEKLIGFFVGQVMKASKGTANPQMVNEILKLKLQP